MQYEFISNDHELDQFCQTASACEAIAVDTEFVRTRTLYPQLGLIQIYDGKRLVLIDPLAIQNFAPLKALLVNPDVVKVLHSCSEDLETFWYALKCMPTPIFDSQFAASILGMGHSMGYAKLIETMLGVIVDKGESRTDWLARPLSPEQCQYAAYDVLYLLQIYPQLKKATEEKSRLEWVYAEMQHLARKKQTPVSPELAYLGIAHNWQLQGKALYILKELAAWRVKQARERDMALNFVVRENHLFEVAKKQPQNKTALFSLEGMTPHEARVNGEALLEIVEKAKTVPPELYPANVERLMDLPAFKKTAAAIRQLCQEVADKLEIPVELMGSKKQVNQLLSYLWFELDETRHMGLEPDLLSAWRREYLQSGLEKILGVKLK
jgi:ribonuclease D